jgi:dolichyl-phosphate-mannose-protein mannosyltransferase
VYSKAAVWGMKKEIRGILAKATYFSKKNSFLVSAVYILFVLGISYPIYFKNYFLPTAPYWDEVYHIPSAAKYIQKVHFMEPHPPLGKMLMAWGEELLSEVGWRLGWELNGGRTFDLEKTEVSPLEMPEGFTFVGYRLFPAMAGWLNALLFTFILVELLGSSVWALVFLPLYLFDNALIAQSRGAMLDSLLLFGFFLSLLGFLKVLNAKKWGAIPLFRSLFMMVFGFAFAFMTKVLGLILILLWPILFWLKRSNKSELWFLLKASFFQMIFFFIFCFAVWSYHFNNSRSIEPSLRLGGNFYASSDYEKVLIGLPHSSNGVEKFYYALKDNIKYFWAYEKGVETYDQNKGHFAASFPISWPFGGRPLFYHTTNPDEFPKRFLMMIPNLAIWFTGLLGFLICFGVVLAGFLMGKRIFSDRTTNLMSSLLCPYVCYMLAMMSIKRALFLFHYMIPLTLSFFLFALLCFEIIHTSKSARARNATLAFTLSSPLLFFLVFLYLKPMTYFEPITCKEAYARVAVPYWGVHLSFCPEPGEIHSSRQPPSKRIYNTGD